MIRRNIPNKHSDGPWGCNKGKTNYLLFSDDDARKNQCILFETEDKKDPNWTGNIMIETEAHYIWRANEPKYYSPGKLIGYWFMAVIGGLISLFMVPAAIKSTYDYFFPNAQSGDTQTDATQTDATQSGDTQSGDTQTRDVPHHPKRIDLSTILVAIVILGFIVMFAFGVYLITEETAVMKARDDETEKHKTLEPVPKYELQL